MAYYVTRSFLFIEIQMGEELTKKRKYYLNLGATSAYANRIMDTTKALYKNNSKGATKDCFLFESWFNSNS